MLTMLATLLLVVRTQAFYYSCKMHRLHGTVRDRIQLRHLRLKDLIVALRYKLRMFGVPVDDPTRVFCDNQGVVKNASLPESTLGKKHNAINYHAVREAAAAGILQVGKEYTKTNLADFLTKVLSGEQRRALVGQLTY